MSDTLQRLKTALADAYAIERELGSGGMAIVYLARDLKHDRDVAVKVLRPELAASLGPERFLREIQITAKLSHPHILPLYDSGEAAGFLYYVMPYVEGESLHDRLSREQQLPIDDVIQIGREVADALDYAHSSGLVHRDIKTENIMLSGGHAVVSDFGIARAVSAAGGGKLTQTGTAIGTPAYMSPEQATGSEHVDGRSDIYSLGCVLYEMLIGQAPFTGPTPYAVMARHSMDEVPRPQIMRSTIPDELEDVIMRALAKAPVDRFQTGAEFSEALAAVGSTATLPRRGVGVARAARRGVGLPRSAVVALSLIALVVVGWAAWRFLLGGPSSPSRGAVEGALDPRRVAVLYFDDLSPGGELGYLADGFTEGVIGRLSQVRALDVISRNGVAPYKQGDVPRDEIAQALNVGSLIDGSIEEVGDKLHVTVRLVDGESGVDVQRTGFELSADQLLAVQDSVAHEVSRILREWIGEEIRLREERAGTTSDEAWVLVQRGEKFRKDAEALFRNDDPAGTFQTFQRADSILASAETADPRWVKPIVIRGQIAYRRSRLSQDLDEIVEWINVGMAHAERALELEAIHPEALELRGTLRYWYWLLELTPDPTESTNLLRSAQQDLEAAVEADPTLASAYSTLSHLYHRTEDIVRAVLAAQSAYEEDAYLSVASDVVHRLFLCSYDLDEHTQAARWVDEGLRRFPEDYRFVDAQLWLMTMDAAEPDVDEAWRLFGELEALTPEPLWELNRLYAQMAVGGVIGRAGLVDSARSVLERSRGNPDIDPSGELFFIEAAMRALLGDYDEAFQLLRRYMAGSPERLFEPTKDVHWWWRDMYGDPRFRELTRARERVPG